MRKYIILCFAIISHRTNAFFTIPFVLGQRTFQLLPLWQTRDTVWYIVWSIYWSIKTLVNCSNWKLRSWWLSRQQPTVSEPWSAHCGPLMGGRVWVFTPLRSRRTVVCAFWWRTWAEECLRASSGRSWKRWTFMSRQSCSSVPAVVTTTQTRTALSLPTSFYQGHGGPRCLRYDQSLNSAVCECRWSRTWLHRVPCNANAASASDTRSVTADTRPGASRVVALTSPVCAQPRANSLSAVAAGAITQRVTGAVLNGRKRGQPLQSERQKVCGRAQPQANPLLLKPSGPDPLPSRRIWARAGTTSSDGACCQSHHHSNT